MSELRKAIGMAECHYGELIVLDAAREWVDLKGKGNERYQIVIELPCRYEPRIGPNGCPDE